MLDHAAQFALVELLALVLRAVVPSPLVSVWLYYMRGLHSVPHQLALFALELLGHLVDPGDVSASHQWVWELAVLQLLVAALPVKAQVVQVVASCSVAAWCLHVRVALILLAALLEHALIAPRVVVVVLNLHSPWKIGIVCHDEDPDEDEQPYLVACHVPASGARAVVLRHRKFDFPFGRAALLLPLAALLLYLLVLAAVLVCALTLVPPVA